MTGCYGQDWASYQSPAPDVTGLSFAFVKATEGLTYVNPRRDAQAAYARLNKLVVGHYHYPHMANTPATEADRFLAVARPQPGDVLALDWEGYDAANRGVTTPRLIAYKNAWLAHVRGAMPTHQVGTYCNGDYLSRDPKGGYGDFLWIASAGKPAGQPGISHQWMFHQFSTSGGIDHDFCPMTADQLRAWSHAKEAPVKTPPKGNPPPVDANDFWNFGIKASDDKNAATMAAYRYLRGTNADVKYLETLVTALTAQVAALAAKLPK